jgi:hypothetical protein
MMHKSYELAARLPAAKAMQRMEGLFTEEGVQFTRTDTSITSLKTPIGLGRLDARNYSKRNWVGLNPFTFVSGVTVRCEPGAGDVRRISLEIDQFRAYVWFAFWAACSLAPATVMPRLEVAILFILGVTVAAWLLIVRFLGGFLIKEEILDSLSLPET